jgi:hypothetical protein
MLIEMAAYGLAVNEGWLQLRSSWIEQMKIRFGDEVTVATDLGSVTLVGIAPISYWDRCLGNFANDLAGKVPSDSWQIFWKIVDKLATRFSVKFACVDGDDGDPLPVIKGAHELDLRKLTG